MRFIKVTQKFGGNQEKEVFVNLFHIQYIEAKDLGSQIILQRGNTMLVKESPSDVIERAKSKG